MYLSHSSPKEFYFLFPRSLPPLFTLLFFSSSHILSSPLHSLSHLSNPPHPPDILQVPASLGKLGCIVNLAGNVGLEHGPDVPQSERDALVAFFHATKVRGLFRKSQLIKSDFLDLPYSVWVSYVISYSIFVHHDLSYPIKSHHILSYPFRPVLLRTILSHYLICDTTHPATVHHLVYLALILLLRRLLSHQAL